jgi:hypothetical protein
MSSPPAASHSNALAFFLGLFLGPVGLWYKGRWALGFLWLVACAILIPATGLLAAPVLWLGMALHAASARPAGSGVVEPHQHRPPDPLAAALAAHRQTFERRIGVAILVGVIAIVLVASHHAAWLLLLAGVGGLVALVQYLNWMQRRP